MPHADLGHRASFTLIELLITIGIVAVLSVVVIVTLNPIQMLKQARDSNRLAHMNTLAKAVSFFVTDQTGASLGAASTTYFSVVDPTATTTTGTHCQGTGLAAPVGWTYRCAASSTVRKSDGTGWMPVNFDQMSFRAISALPVDPQNTTSSGAYYTYTPSAGKYAFTTALESEKYLPKTADDGGYDAARFEVGSDLSLVARSEGLVGWWKMEESSGSEIADSSGLGYSGTLSGSATFGQTGKVGNAILFNGSTTYMTMGVISDLKATSSLSVLVWIKPSDMSRPDSYIGGPGGTGFYGYLLRTQSSDNRIRFQVGNGGATAVALSTSTLSNDTWYHIAGTYDGSNIRIYVNGTLRATQALAGPISYSGTTNNGTFRIGQADDVVAGRYWPGTVDEFSVYNRVLNGTEIAAIYDATNN